MKSLLESLPIELVEHVVTLLDARDVFSLRLTSRNIEIKASQGNFNALFSHKNVELSTKVLQEMVYITSQSRFGRRIQHCTITGIARDETIVTYEEGEHLGPLTVSFQNIKQRSPTASLTSLSLRVTARTEDGDGVSAEPSEFLSQKAVWCAALHAFETTMAALSESQLSVDGHIDIFGSLRGCSLEHSSFLAFFQKPTAKHVFRSVKKLAISLSVPYIVDGTNSSEREINGMHIPVQNKHTLSIVRNIIPVLRVMPELESLDLHWWDTRLDKYQYPSTTHQDNSTTYDAPSRPLRECSLRGFYVSEHDLLQFLNATRPQTLTLTDIHLVSGTYNTVFDYITGTESLIMDYFLDDLMREERLVHFDDVPGDPKFPYLDRTVGPSTLARHGSHAREAIHYHFPSRRALGSGNRYRWSRMKGEEFGYREGARYDFIRLNSETTVLGNLFEGSDDD
ncbi:hypothetical protein F5Y04DRAFT_288777 [Hypomontagnella monticulosa]|nr:hypothetical protein F5Y04DRAFT_288777 [Hypomontagnella monticulosa]